MLLVDIVLYTALAVYLDEVLPKQFGIQQKPWFCCLKSYWRGGGAAEAGEEYVALEEGEGGAEGEEAVRPTTITVPWSRSRNVGLEGAQS